MYNRYLRNDNGDYARIYPLPQSQSAPSPASEATSCAEEKKSPFDFFSRILRQLHLNDLDGGDLMLLLLLFFLFEEGADEELLIALGLLLVL